MTTSKKDVNTRTCLCITDFCNGSSKENDDSEDNGASETAAFGLLVPTIIFMILLY